MEHHGTTHGAERQGGAKWIHLCWSAVLWSVTNWHSKLRLRIEFGKSLTDALMVPMAASYIIHSACSRSFNLRSIIQSTLPRPRALFTRQHGAFRLLKQLLKQLLTLT